MNRREFLRQTGGALGAAAGGWLAGCGESNRNGSGAKWDEQISVIYDKTDPVASSAQARWAIGEVRSALGSRGFAARDVPLPMGTRATQFNLLVSGANGELAKSALLHPQISIPGDPESLALTPTNIGYGQSLLACGRDVRGLVYALTEIADAIRLGNGATPLPQLSQPIVEKPANPVRGIMRLFASEVEDKPWFYDREFWTSYLTMLVSNRFNRFNLALGLGYDFARDIRDSYFYFAYPFFLQVPGYNVRAVGLPDAEREKNLETLRFISEAAVARGLHFQLGIWSHVAKWANSPNANYTIEGLKDDEHAAYCRDALKRLLQSCPAIGGITFRIHGESGIPEGHYDFWKTLFEGVAQCGRPVQIDLHAKGIDQEMIDIALATGLPVTVAPKSWAEHTGLSYHQGSIRPTEMPPKNRPDQGFFAKSSGSRSFMRYGYGDLLKEDRRYGIVHRMWPGTQRLLLWGDPALAAGYGRTSSFCGSLGLELFEPLSFKGRQGSGLPGGRCAYADKSLEPKYDFEKYEYGYRLWGRMLYNPQTQPVTWKRLLRKQVGAASEAAESSLSHASRILPLITTAHCPSAANFNYWPEMYTNMPIVNASRPHPYGDTPSPRRFGTVSPLDPQLFSRIDDFADQLLKGQWGDKYSPAEVAQWIAGLANEAARDLASAKDKSGADRVLLRRLVADVTLQIGIGHFFADKLRAGVLYALFDRTGDPTALDEALRCYRAARQAWADAARAAESAYVADITFGPPRHLRGHWSDRLPAIDQDLADMEAKKNSRAAGEISDETRRAVASAIREVLAPPPRPDFHVRHEPPGSFRPGDAVRIELAMSGNPDVRLLYRHVNQAESWRNEPMKSQGDAFAAEVPGDYTHSPYPLQYYFLLRAAPASAALYPGLGATLTDQPYFVLRQHA